MTPARNERGYHVTTARAGDHHAGDAFELHADAELSRTITLHGAGLLGGADYSRTLPAGTPVEVMDDAVGGGLARIRYRPGDDIGVLVGVEDLVRHDG